MNDVANTAVAEIEIHPKALVYRMHTAEELEMLVASIKRNGLRDPITLCEAGSIIDGRNRHKACGIAGVAPRFETFKGDEDDIADFIFDKNATRRDIDMGQKAIAYALLFPKGDNTYTGKKSKQRTVDSAGGILSASRVSEARCIVEFAKAEVDKIVEGEKTFKEIYRIAAERKREQEPAESRIAKIEAKDKRLADLVRQREISLDAAETEIEVREKRLRERRAGAIAFLQRAVTLFEGLGDDDLVSIFADGLTIPSFLADVIKALELDADRLAEIQSSAKPATAVFNRILTLIKERL